MPKALLSDFTGVLQTDLYAGYNEVYVPDKAIRAGCWAHVRRKFIEVQKLAPAKDVTTVLKLIADMYRAEAQLKDRQKVIAPLVEQIFNHISNWSLRTLPQSEVQKPLQYALKQREALSLFLTNPSIRLDNNLIENQMRPIALGRKNWLFAGSHEGAMRAAIFFSFINSCRLLKINTWRYFNDILPKLAIGSVPLLNLLPHNWKFQHKN